MDHNYDGIHELDHPLPSWWLATFYISIVFAVLYSAYYLTGIGPTLIEELQISMEIIDQKKPAEAADADESAILASLHDPVRLKNGAVVFAGKCAACHGDKGQGVIGPNLTDKYWLHGGQPGEIAKVIGDGVLEKGMPPWKAILSPDELVDVSAFVKSLLGTNPPGGKEAQGELVEIL